MNQRTAKRLLDASIAIERLTRYVKGKTFADYESDDYLRSAVERQFEVLAEALNIAANHESSLEHQIPELRTIVGLRNRIAHEYDELDDQIIWDTVKEDIASLATSISVILAELPAPGEAP